RMGVIIMTPAQPEIQGAWHGNVYETHRSAFQPKDFADYPYRLAKVVRESFQRGRLIIFLSAGPIVVSQWGPTSGTPFARRVRDWWAPSLRMMGRQLPLPVVLRRLFQSAPQKIR